jgi:hypothetical protein
MVARPATAQVSSGAAFSPTISYQGSIASGGQPVPDGSYDISVRLYGDSTGADTIWQGTYNTAVQGGVFSILLGSGATPLPSPSIMDRQLWIGVRINNGTEFRPLSQLAATPYALNVSDNAITTNKLAPGSVTGEKVSFPYLGGLVVGGQRVGNPGDAINLIGANGIELTYDSLARSITFGGTVQGSGPSDNGKGSSPQANTTIIGTLTVTSTTTLNTAGGSTTIDGNTILGANNSDTVTFNAVAGSNLNMNGYGISNLGPLNLNSLTLGTPSNGASPTTGSLILNNASSAYSATVHPAALAANEIYTIPDAGASANFVLTTATSGWQAGDLLYAAQSGNALTRLAAGTNSQALTMVSGLPAWANVVTSVSVSGGSTGLTTSGGPITTSGTITLGGTLGIANGGTGQTTRAAALNALLPDSTGNSGKALVVQTGGGYAWLPASGVGTVTSIDVSGGSTGLTTTGGAITSNGTITLGGTLGAANGGTGQSTYTTGDMLYASSSSLLSRLPAGSSNQVLGMSGGTPTWTQNGATITNTVNTPTALNSTPVNDYVVDSSSTYIRLNNMSGGLINLTGISSAGVANGRVITLFNTSVNPIMVKNQNTGSATANQFSFPGGADILIGPKGAATFIYDQTSGFWELVSTN